MRPSLLKDPAERRQLAEEICTMIDAGEDQKGPRLQERWRNCESRYRGEPDEQGLQVYDDSEPMAINIVAPRVDALVTKVCQPLTSQRPYYSALGYDRDRNRLTTNENVVQFCYERAGYHRLIRQATRLSCMAAPAIFRCRHAVSTEDRLAASPSVSADISRPYRFVGPLIEVIHPNDFVLYPLIAGGIQQAKLVGHRFHLRVREVKELQQAGVYLDTDTFYGGDDPQSWESGRSQEWSLTEESSGIAEPDDEQAELWDVLVKLDLDGDGYEERYRATVARTSRVLLDLEFYGVEIEEDTGIELPNPIPFPYDPSPFENIRNPRSEIRNPNNPSALEQIRNPKSEIRNPDRPGPLRKRIPFSRPWYFEHYVKPPAYGEFFHANPPVQDLIPCQAVYSDGMTLLVEGGKAQAFPCGFVDGSSTQLSGQVKRYRPGEFHYLPAGARITFVSANFDPSVWPLLLQSIKLDADANLRISQNGTGQAIGRTATESTILQNNQEEGADEYRDNAAQSGEEMADFIRELCFLHYDQVKGAHGHSFPCEDAELLREPLRWEASGKTSATAPQVLTQNFHEILSLIQIPGLAQATGLNLPALVKAYVKTKKLPVPDSDLFPEGAGMEVGNGNALGGSAATMDPQPGGPAPNVAALLDLLASSGESDSPGPDYPAN